MRYSRHLDVGSQATVVVTLVLFVVSLFVKGFGHDILLESGVFLVSVKLILMSYKNSVATREVTARLAGLEQLLTRVDGRLDGIERGTRA